MVNQAHISYPFLLALLVAVIVGYTFDTLEMFVVLLASFFPDIDYLYEMYIRRKHPNRQVSHHRFITHAPLFYVPVVIVLSIVDLKIGILTLYGLLTHFAMDSLVAPDGIRWLAPFKQKYYLWTSYTKGIYNVQEWLQAYKRMPVYIFDNIAFVVTVVLVIYFVVV